MGSKCGAAGRLNKTTLLLRKRYTRRKRKERPYRGSNPRLPLFMKGTLTTELPGWFVEESSIPKTMAW